MSIKDDFSTIKNLLYFVEATKSCSISRAAINMGVKQSNLSSSISSLEKELNVKLLSRIHNGVTTTDTGQKIFEMATEFERVLYRIRNFSTSGHKVSGQIKLWTTDGLGTGCITAYLPDYYAKYPNVSIDFRCSNNYLKIAPRDADIAILYHKPPVNNDTWIISEHMMRFTLFASLDYIAQHGMPKDMRDLMKNHKICERVNFSDVWQEWSDVVKQSRYVVSSTNSSSVLLGLTKDGIGVALHPMGIAAKEKNLVKLDCLNFYVEHPYWLVCKTASKDVPKVRTLIEFLKGMENTL